MPFSLLSIRMTPMGDLQYVFILLVNLISSHKIIISDLDFDKIFLLRNRIKKQLISYNEIHREDTEDR
jgi:hypothetical protein